MASPNASSSELPQSFDADSRRKAEEVLRAKERELQDRSQARLGELIEADSTLPITVSSITVLNAHQTRKGFLGSIFKPILSANNEAPYTLRGAVDAISIGAGKLERFGIYESPISIFFDRPDQTDPSTTPTDISAFISVKERSRFSLQATTWAGSNEGSLEGNLFLRNLLGGAESFYVTGTRGTRTKWSAASGLSTPILSNPDLIWEIGGQVSDTQKSWASHTESLKGANTRLRWLTSSGHRHELGYSGTWRQVTGLSEKASPTVRGDAGDSFKSSLSHVWMNERRDNPMLPSGGYMVKTVSELAGVGPLNGDVSFAKIEAQTQGALPIPVPFLKRESGISMTLGLRGGVLYPLAQSADTAPQSSRINDRFTLGGSADVRGFRDGGLGPHDGADAVGGDIYAAGGASLLLPFPNVGKDHPLRLQAFVNAGRLIGLQDVQSRTEKVDSSLTSSDMKQSVRNAFSELGNGVPSVAAGLGVVYAAPVARFEVNFSLPLVLRQGEEARKGISLGIGMEFL